MGALQKPWRVELFGGLKARQGDTVVSKFQTQKTGALLAFLALDVGKNFSRERLATTLWSSGDAVALRNRLNQAVSSLRRQLELSGSGRVFVSDHHFLGLDPNTIVTDVEEFLKAVETARIARQPADRKRALEAAVRVYTGELLEGFSEPWIYQLRHQYATEFRDVLRQLVRVSFESNEPALAADYANRLVSADPSDEQAHADLIEALAASGRGQAALGQYEYLVRYLGARGISPSQATTDLSERVRLSVGEAITVDRPAPQKEAVVELPAEPEPFSTTLPRPYFKLINREEEASTLERLLMQERERVVSIVGIGGSGKSRLAIEIAHRLREEGFEHVIFVFVGHGDRQLELVDQIGLAVCPDVPVDRRNREIIVERLRALGQSFLILDTAEHVLADELSQIGEFLELVPHLQVLSTSRRPLRLPGEILVPLGPLKTPDDTLAPPAHIARNESVMLFVQRAQAFKPDFQVTSRTSEAIAKLCVRLEGLPLSLELAAGWIRSMTPAQMCDRLDQRLNFLASRRRDIDDRHRTIRAVLDSTVALLPKEVQDTFLRLSVFDNSFDHRSARAICPDADIDFALDALLELNIIQRLSTLYDRARFTILETLRDYAFEVAPSDLLREVRSLHAHHFMELVEGKADAENANQPDAMRAIISQEYQNCLTAMQWFMENGRGSDLGRTACALVDYWESVGSLNEGLRWMEEALRLCQDGDRVKTRLLIGISRFSWFTGDKVRSRNSIEQAMVSARNSGQEEDILEALIALQQERHNSGEADEAARLAEEALKLAERLGNVSVQSRMYLRMGNAALDHKDWQTAREDYEQSLNLGREAHDAVRIAGALTNLGVLGLRTGQLDLSKLWLLEAINMGRAEALVQVVSICAMSLATVEARLGNRTLSLRWLQEAYRSLIENQFVLADLFLASAEVSHSFGDTPRAAKFLGILSTLQQTNSGLGYELKEVLESTIRKSLGDGPFETNYQFGRALTIDAARALVRDLVSEEAGKGQDGPT
ncbi:MAG: hypothetical protein JSS66_04000 [Armatimonadetes bacterium]|nr:hypothetical protein [Armatimonadota bacterium]